MVAGEISKINKIFKIVSLRSLLFVMIIIFPSVASPFIIYHTYDTVLGLQKYQ
jgi:hypothetical protein